MIFMIIMTNSIIIVNLFSIPVNTASGKIMTIYNTTGNSTNAKGETVIEVNDIYNGSEIEKILTSEKGVLPPNNLSLVLANTSLNTN